MDSRRFDPFYRPSVSKNIGGGGGRGDNQQLYDPESPRDSPSPDSFRSSDGRNRNSGYSRLSSGYGPQSYRDESAYSRPYPSNTSHSTMRRSPSPPRGTRYPPAPTLSSSPPSSRGGDYPPPPSARQQQHYHHQQATPTPPPPPLASHQHQSFDPFEDFGDMDSPGSRSRSASWSPRERSETAPGGETSVVPSPPPPPSFSEDSQKDKDPNPLSMLLENKNVSLSSLLEAALEPTGNKTVVEDPALKKKVLLSCQTTIAMLYRSRVSGIGSFVPQPIKPVVVIVDDCNDNNPLLLQHPRLEFNALPGDSSWKCPSVSVEVDKLMKSSRVDDDDDDDVTDQGKEVGMPISTVVNVKGMVTAPPPVVTRPVEYTSHMNTSQPFYALPPVYYPPRQVYPQMPFPQQQRPLTAGVTPQFQEREKSSSEKERKEKKKKKKRAKSRSRSRGRHGSRGRNRSRSRRRGRSRSRGKSRGRRGSRGNSRGSRGRSRGRRSRSVSKGRKQQQPQTNVAPHETPPAWLPQQFNQNFPPQPRPNFPPPFQQQQFWRPPPMNAPPQHFMPHHHNQPSNWMTPLPQPVAPPVGAWTQPPIAPVPPPNPVPPPRPILPPSPMPPRVNYPAPVPRPPLVTPQPAAFPSAMYMARKERVLLPIPVMFTSPPPPIPGTSPPVVDLTEPRSGREDKDSRRIDEDSRSRDRDERQEDGDDRRRDRRRERDRDGQNRRGRDRSRSNERHRYRERDGERDREKDKDRQRDRDRDRDRDRIKDSDRRDRDKDQRKKDRKNDDRRRDSSTERKKSKPGQDKTKSSDKEEKRSSKDRKTDEPGRKENETNREKENETNRGKENETNRGKENETNRGMENASNRSETVTMVDPPEYPSTNAEAKEADEGENEPKETDPERHAMNKKLGESLEKISKLIDGIFRIQRDSWELRELIKGLENRQQQNDGIYTLRNRLLCRVCIKSKDKFLKVVIPAASSRQFLKDLHRTYHDMSMNDMVDLLTDTFHEIPGPKTKLGLIMKECPTCKSQPTAPKADGGRFKAAEKRKLDHDGGVENDDGGGGGGVGDESKNPPAAPENESSTVGGQPSTKRNRRKQTRKKKKQQLKSTNQTQKTEGPPPLQQPTAEPFRSPAVEPDATSSAAGSAPPHEAKRDFKSLVRQVQTNKVEFKIIINRLESNNRDDLDPSFVMKGGMLCKKCFIDGKSEIRIIIKNEQLDEMIKIVHELGPCHASVQKTMEVFNKHFSPIENLDEIVANFVSNCPVCKRK